MSEIERPWEVELRVSGGRHLSGLSVWAAEGEERFKIQAFRIPWRWTSDGWEFERWALNSYLGGASFNSSGSWEPREVEL